jgi:hypothetical protein
MDRIWQRVWDRYTRRYSWAVFAILFLFALPIYVVWSILIIAVEESNDYLAASAVTVAAVPALVCSTQLPYLRRFSPVERWAAGEDVDRSKALEATYALTRGAVVHSLVLNAVWGAWCFLLSGGLPEHLGRTSSHTRSWVPL